jgi:hypothetical protein
VFRYLLPAFTVLLACAPAIPPGALPGAELRVSPREVEAGGEITLTLVNHSREDIGYNLCPVVLERRGDGEWRLRPERPAEVCTMELRILSPDQSADFRHRIPSGLPPGEYRFRAGIEHPLGERQTGIASHPFRIR